MRLCLAVTCTLPAFCLAAFLTGCQYQPQLSHLSARKDGDKVQLCLSSEPACPQQGGISISSISVYRYDNTHDNQLIWDAEPDNEGSAERIDGLVTYGVPPAHWRNKMTPPPLVCGKAYLVNPGANYFGLNCDGTVVVFDAQHLYTFSFQQDAAPATAKQPDDH